MKYPRTRLFLFSFGVIMILIFLFAPIGDLRLPFMTGWLFILVSMAPHDQLDPLLDQTCSDTPTEGEK